MSKPTKEQPVKERIHRAEPKPVEESLWLPECLATEDDRDFLVAAERFFFWRAHQFLDPDDPMPVIGFFDDRQQWRAGPMSWPLLEHAGARALYCCKDDWYFRPDTSGLTRRLAAEGWGHWGHRDDHEMPLATLVGALRSCLPCLGPTEDERSLQRRDILWRYSCRHLLGDITRRVDVGYRSDVIALIGFELLDYGARVNEVAAVIASTVCYQEKFGQYGYRSPEDEAESLQEKWWIKNFAWCYGSYSDYQ